jgi:hypothetical protein
MEFDPQKLLFFLVMISQSFACFAFWPSERVEADYSIIQFDSAIRNRFGFLRKCGL